MKRAVLTLLTVLFAGASDAARVTVGTATGAQGGTAAVPITFASEGASVSSFSVDLLFSAPLSYTSVAASATATGAGKTAQANPITGGVRLIVFGFNQTLMPDGAVATVTLGISASAANGSYAVTASNAAGSDPSGNAVALSQTSGSVTVGSTTTAATFVLPSSARAQGAGGAFYTTDLTVANTGTTNGTFILKFLGHDADGRGGAEVSYSVAAGKSVTVQDVLGTAFGVSSGYGAIQVKASVATIAVSGQTSTPAPASIGGTFGQSVPAVGSAGVIGAAPRSILGVREDGSFRTNLILANWGEATCAVDVTLVQASGATAGPKRYTLSPLGMTQAANVVRALGVTGDVSGARLVLVSATSGGSFAAYASVIDNKTNDPRTLLPQ